MQRGSLEMVSRKEGPAVWQFRWSEKDFAWNSSPTEAGDWHG